MSPDVAIQILSPISFGKRLLEKLLLGFFDQIAQRFIGPPSKLSLSRSIHDGPTLDANPL